MIVDLVVLEGKDPEIRIDHCTDVIVKSCLKASYFASWRTVRVVSSTCALNDKQVCNELGIQRTIGFNPK